MSTSSSGLHHQLRSQVLFFETHESVTGGRGVLRSFTVDLAVLDLFL